MDPIRIALIGAGQVVRDQHIPVLSKSATFRLLGVVSPYEPLAGWPNYSSIEQLLKEHPDLQAVAVCTPPQVRFDLAREALAHGLNVLLEKPPCQLISEVDALIEQAIERNLTLFAAWHSREAPAVEHSRTLLEAAAIRKVEVRWLENVREMHPGQTWLWKNGGLGVFDPGINALSILTRILPGRVELEHADLTFPANCKMPSAASLRLSSSCGAPIIAEFDFLYSGPMEWEIEIQCADNHLLLSKGGAVLHLNGQPQVTAPSVAYANLHEEYSRLYAKFDSLIHTSSIDVDHVPLSLALEALASGTRRSIEAFRE